jgi:hypothetical protein
MALQPLPRLRDLGPREDGPLRAFWRSQPRKTATAPRASHRFVKGPIIESGDSDISSAEGRASSSCVVICDHRERQPAWANELADPTSGVPPLACALQWTYR